MIRIVIQSVMYCDIPASLWHTVTFPVLAVIVVVVILIRLSRKLIRELILEQWISHCVGDCSITQLGVET